MYSKVHDTCFSNTNTKSLLIYDNKERHFKSHQRLLSFYWKFVKKTSVYLVKDWVLACKRKSNISSIAIYIEQVQITYIGKGYISIKLSSSDYEVKLSQARSNCMKLYSVTRLYYRYKPQFNYKPLKISTQTKKKYKKRIHDYLAFKKKPHWINIFQDQENVRIYVSKHLSN